MKKISKILLVLLLLTISTVKAEDCSNVVMYSRDNFISDAVKMRYGSESDGRWLTLKDVNSRNMPTYCHNVSKPTGARYGGTTFRCTKILFDSTNKLVSSDLRSAFEAGIVKILVNGYNVKNTGSGKVGYTATDLAIKTFELLWPSNINSNNMNSGTATNYLKAYQSFANKMLDDSEVVAKLKEAGVTSRNKYSNALSYTWESNGTEIENRARELIILGLNESIRFKKEGAASISWNSNPIVSKDASLGDGKYSGSISYTFKISNFKSSGAFAKAKFNCENCNANGVNYKVYVNDEELGQNYNNEIDLLSRVTNGTGDVTLKIQFNSNSNYGCEGLDYKIDLSYKEDTISNEAYEMHSTDSSCSGKTCQPLYVLNNYDITKTAIIENEFSLCNITCQELQNRCKSQGSSSKACQEFNKQYPNGCINCGVGIVNNVCADPGNTTDLALIEGYEVDPETCTQSTEENITGCIIENKDAAGNSYVDETLGNNLCSVSCKEDFHFTLPGNLDVSNGRFFSLKTDVKATKTCYLKMNGNPSSAFSSFEAGARKTQEKKFECAKIEALNNLTCTPKTKTFSCGTQPVTTIVTTYKGYNTMAKCEEHYSTVECMNGRSTKEITTYEEKLSDPLEYYECDYTYSAGGCSSLKGNDTYKSYPNVAYINGSCQVVDKAESPKEANPKADILSCNSDLGEMTSKASVTEYTSGGVAGDSKVYVYGGSFVSITGGSSESIYNLVGGFNACAFWEMNYDFNADMYFNYEESYMKNALTDKLDLIGEYKKSGTTHMYCASDDGDSTYTSCRSGWKSEPIFNSASYCVCNSSGCNQESISVNGTMRMKESISYEASYITPTQFYSIYPTGAIVVAKSCEGIENCSELTNALPVGLGSPQGIRHYALYAKNLGEYFGKGKFGRVWGDKNSVVSTTLRSSDKCINTGSLKYDTDINGTYIDKGVWVCDYNVNANKCTKTINEDGKVTYRDKNGNITDAFTYDRECVCPDCPVTCDPNGCSIACTGDNCPVICPTCLYNNGRNFAFRAISLSNLNPNNRNLGANWKYDDQISTALEMKAKLTTDEIITDGETIYDDNSNKYVMKMTMDSAMINKIKSRKEKDYTANTLKCYDYTQDGKTYNNIFCYSTLLDELLNDSKTKDKIKFGSNRPLTEAERKNSQNSEYWTTWTKKLESSKWSVNTTRELSYYKTNYGEIGIGPSWK